jgi:heat shock protein HslJ
MLRKLKHHLFMLLFVLIAVSCAGDLTSKAAGNSAIKDSEDPAVEDSGNPVPISRANIADIQDKDWYLTEIKSNTGTVRIDRTKPGAAEVYTIRFEAERLGGMGAPNRFFAPFTAGEANALSIGMMASTLMVPLFENEDLKEQEYYNYLNRVNRWDLRNGTLELYTTSENGSQVVLEFTLKSS